MGLFDVDPTGAHDLALQNKQLESIRIRAEDAGEVGTRDRCRDDRLCEAKEMST